MRALVLEPLTVDDAPPLQLAESAADAGADMISLVVQTRPSRPDWGLNRDPALRRALKARCADLGLGIDTCESFRLLPQTNLADWAPAIDVAVELDATSVTLLAQDDDRVRMADRFGRFREMVVSAGLTLYTEFTPRVTLKTVGQTLMFLDAHGFHDVRITADALHIVRSGDTIEALAAARDRIGRLQLCDGPLTPPADPLHEAMSERAYPGDGEFPLVEIIRALAPDTPIAVEAPSAALIKAGVSITERVTRAMAATRRVLALAA